MTDTEIKIVNKARDQAVRLSELAASVREGSSAAFYEREGSVIVRDPEKLIALMESLTDRRPQW
jgi:hypothetical protein